MGPGNLPLAADAKPSPIDLDHRQCRPGLNPRRELLGPGLARPVIPPGLQLLADLPGDAADLAAADGQLGQVFEGLGSLLEGGLPGGGADDLAKDRGAVAMWCEPQARALRGKIPATGLAATLGLGVGHFTPPRSEWPSARVAPGRGAGRSGKVARVPASRPSSRGVLRRPPLPRHRRRPCESLDLVGIEVEVGADLVLDPTGHDFSPSLSHLSDARRIDRR
jgi:hypothetical protein